ncbi:MAG: 2-C-methyl-D-erythritol 2,4-cyclodiphosphate synthase [Clostridia bacterium]|nr:2-C-methyl-D-erythritol 2,4-cyclodiphosphate synthase [Clostridia bacterium]
MIRIGYGYDVHKLIAGRELFLCGEKIEYEKGLLGHSDADVALHALCDALLGAAALGDIGKHFPDTDERYRGISSITLLKEVMYLIREKGYKAVNADITISAQKPKLAPYIQKMRQNIADAMETEIDFISVKATTTEGLGFEGRGEGISASAVVLIEG